MLVMLGHFLFFFTRFPVRFVLKPKDERRQKDSCKQKEKPKF